MPFVETPLNENHNPLANREFALPAAGGSHRRFTLRAIFIATTSLAVVCAVVAQVPLADLLRAIKYSPVLVLFTALRTAAIAAAACLVPPALMLSLAWMVLYSRGLQ